jgi:hypothetical protein
VGIEEKGIISSLRAKSFSLLYKISYITHNLQTYGNNTMHPLPPDAYLAGRGCMGLVKNSLKNPRNIFTVKSYCGFYKSCILCLQRPFRFMYCYGMKLKDILISSKGVA